MAKKRISPKSVTRTRSKRLISQTGKSFLIQKTTKSYKRSISIKKKSVEQAFKKVTPDFHSEFKKKKSKGTLFIFRMKMNHNLKGKRIKQGYSTKRTRVRSEKQFKQMLEVLKSDFINDMKKYLRRADYNSITISGVSVEVVKNEKRTKKFKARTKTSRRSKSKRK